MMFRIVKYLQRSLENRSLINFNKHGRLHQNHSKSLQMCLRNFTSTNLDTEKVQESSITNDLTDDEEKKLKILRLEMDVARQEGRNVPDPEFLNNEQWKQLLSLNSRSARSKFYSFLFKLEWKRKNDKERKLKRQEETRLRKEQEKIEALNSDHLIYGLNNNTFLLRIYDTTINHWQNNRLIQAIQFGEKIVFDCSYDPHMTKREAINTAKQLMLSFAENRFHNEPFDLHFCNANLQGDTMKYLVKHIPTALEPWFPLNIHEKCFTEVFPKEKLVYLTPHCKNDLEKFDPDNVYIIGAIVDKTNSEPLSLAKAKKLGLRMARLPLDRYLQWCSGSGKSLTINQMLSILLDLKTTNDWTHSLRHVPRRKITKFDDCKDEDEWDKVVKRRYFRPKAKSSFEFDINKWMVKK